MKQKANVAFICPRYPQNKAGGAEVLCRSLAEKCASLGHNVEILSTTAVNHYTWANELEEHTFRKNNVMVRLFKTNERGDLSHFQEIERKIAENVPLTPEEEKLWCEKSVNSQGLYDYIREKKDKFDYFIFIPYLFGLTINGIKICPEKSVLIPCLHEENFAYLNCIKETFKAATKILFNAPPEMEFAKKLYGLEEDLCHLVSMGFEFNHKPEPDRFRKKHDIPGEYITFAGRREDGKNFTLLLEMVRLFQRIYPGKLSFVTMGTPEVNLISADKGKVFDLGFVSDEEKYDCFAGALLNCQPSVNESFSIVLMESWLCGKPVLVNSACSVTSRWVDMCKGGFKFKDYFEFEQTVIYALEHPEVVREMSRCGKYFVEKNFTWDIVLKRFEQAL